MYLIHQDYEEIHTVATSSSFVPFGSGTALLISIPKNEINIIIIVVAISRRLYERLDVVRACPILEEEFMDRQEDMLGCLIA